MGKHKRDIQKHWEVRRKWSPQGLGPYVAWEPGESFGLRFETWQEAMDYVNERLAHDAEVP